MGVVVGVGVGVIALRAGGSLVAAALVAPQPARTKRGRRAACLMVMMIPR